MIIPLGLQGFSLTEVRDLVQTEDKKEGNRVTVCHLHIRLMIRDYYNILVKLVCVGNIINHRRGIKLMRDSNTKFIHTHSLSPP